MKPLFIFCCLLLTLQSKAANDTLTRAQVYNFSVGDTFDYKIETVYYASADKSFPWYNIKWFKRIIITGIEIDSTHNSSLISQRSYQLVSGDSSSLSRTDTLSIDSSYLYAIYGNASIEATHWCYLTIDTGYIQRTINKTSWNCGPAGGIVADIVEFAEGLGQTSTYLYTSDGSSSSEEYDTTLIYYSKSGQTWGIPATIAVGIPYIPQQNPSITLFPTVNNGQFKLSINAPNNPSPQLIIYDLTGREVKRTSLTNGTNNVTLDNVSAGMYLWSVTSNGAILKSGKLIIQ